jgi:hypothetical protein
LRRLYDQHSLHVKALAGDVPDDVFKAALENFFKSSGWPVAFVLVRDGGAIVSLRQIGNVEQAVAMINRWVTRWVTRGRCYDHNFCKN